MNESSAAYPRRWWALSALAVAAIVVSLDLTILNVALPSLATGLKASTSDLQWFANAYNLVFAALMLPAGLLGDRYGRKKLMLGALVVFGLASAGCAYSNSVGELIAYRALLGLGAAFLLPLGISAMPVLFKQEEMGKAVIVWVTANAIGTPLGPIVGGLLLDHFWWGSVFLINVPVVVVALVMVALLLPESKSPVPPRLDLLGVLLSSAGLVALTFGVIDAGKDGWGSAVTLGSILGGAALLVVFVFYQRALTRRPHGEPLIDLSLFRSRSFTWGTILSTVVTFAMFGVLFAMPQFFQAVDDTSALGTGLRLLPLIGGMLVGSRVAGVVAPKTGPKLTVTLGFVLLAAGLFAGMTTKTGTGFGVIAVWFTVFGAGMGLALPTSMNAALGVLSPDRSGVGSALVQAMRQVGGSIGVAILGTVLTSGYRSALNLSSVPAQAHDAVRQSAAAGVVVAHKLGSPGVLHSVQSAFTHAIVLMLGVCGGIAVAGVVLAALFLPGKNAATATPSEDNSPQLAPQSV